MATTGDSGSRLPDRPGRDLWALPEITSLRIERVRYKTPRKHAEAGKVVDLHEAIEIVIETDGDIPIRALAPALNVGSAQVAENEPAGKARLRFVVTNAEPLLEGAPITLGWVGQPAPRVKARFHYRVPTDSVTR
jgi:hypothetical protein